MKKMDKEAISYKFKWEVLLQDDNHLLSLESRTGLWKIFLYEQSVLGNITKNNANTWIYPEKILRIRKK
jgi:hypothetical protein